MNFHGAITYFVFLYPFQLLFVCLFTVCYLCFKGWFKEHFYPKIVEKWLISYGIL